MRFRPSLWWRARWYLAVGAMRLTSFINSHAGGILAQLALEKRSARQAPR